MRSYRTPQVNSSTFTEMRSANNALGKDVRYMRESVLDVQNLRAITHATTKQVCGGIENHANSQTLPSCLASIITPS
jgi:hypothetical protein